MDRWLTTKAGKDDPLLFVESIPVQETRSYVKRLMLYHWLYRRRFGQDAASLDDQTAQRRLAGLPAPPRKTVPARRRPTARRAAGCAEVSGRQTSDERQLPDVVTRFRAATID